MSARQARGVDLQSVRMLSMAMKAPSDTPATGRMRPLAATSARADITTRFRIATEIPLSTDVP